MSKLSDFLDLPASLGSNRFAEQCLLSPEVVDTGPGDPQTGQIRKILCNFKDPGPLRILDFGAGRGRLASAIYEHAAVDGDLSTRIDYLAFDSSPTYRAICEAAIQRLHGSSNGRYFNQLGDVFGNYSKCSCHTVVMCNVLHEIDPSAWLDLFSAERPLIQFLRHDGFLLLVEDMRMPIGEKAHQKGFLVLDTPHLRTLFQIPENESQFVVADERGDGRLKAHLIPRDCLVKISADSRRAALCDLAQGAKEKIAQLREQEASYAAGRLHGFYVQQFANAHLALSQL